MKNKKNILITCGGGGGPIYLARALKKKHNIFLADGSDQNAAPYLGFPFARIPFGNSPEFPEAITSLIKKWNIDCIVPGADEELLPMIKLTEKQPSLMVLAPSKEFTSLCLDKKKLMERLAELGISNLKGFAKKKEVKYPALAKPIFGRGSRQVHILKNVNQLNGYLELYEKKFDDILVQPYIGGIEYTISVIVNDNNKIIGIVSKRIINKKGITQAAVTEKNNVIDKVCTQIVKDLNPKGTFNVQLKIENKVAYIFEINPRLSTTSVLTDRSFGNEVELFIKYYNKAKIDKPPTLKTPVFLYRYEENIFK